MPGQNMLCFRLGQFDLALFHQLVHPSVGQYQGSGNDDQHSRRKAKPAFTR